MSTTNHSIDVQAPVRAAYNQWTQFEHTGAALGFLDRRVKGDLERFKQLVERQGEASGGWRGTIEDHPNVSAG